MGSSRSGRSERVPSGMGKKSRSRFQLSHRQVPTFILIFFREHLDRGPVVL